MDVHRILVDITTSIVIIIILLAFSAFFGGLEVALVAITDVQIEQFLLEKKKGAKSLKKFQKHFKHLQWLLIARMRKNML